ncbi:nitrilase [Parahaliea maris]|uniref:Nitrilase n=1 Tax=Parahaliea maris TaxID=2716870 RepID=A0A5C8ZU34_9GAMM|nr:nitrilase-related carbon-nitrogen hydrolase [Parahaliea maris]TXS92005.1 nitrilase [Parahaliea maris]
MKNQLPLPYAALALQVTCASVNALRDREAVEQSMLATINRLGRQIRASKAFIGPQVRLVVLPEYFLTGFPMGESVPEWGAKSAIEMDGRIYELLGKTASDHNVFLSGNVYELDPYFPELYFQTSFILNDSGDVVLRYRRLISMFAPTPHDVLDRYLDVYGSDSLFPVVDTELGCLACVASEEILYPEISRAMVLKGAEIICHSSSEVGSPAPTPKNTAKAARAYENHCYVVSANSAGINDIDIPFASTDGGSRIVDFHGQVLAVADTGESMVANADLDIAHLRHYRRRPSMFNTLTRQRLELFADVYGKQCVYPANTLLDGDQVRVPDRSHFLDTQAQVIQRKIAEGML